ncbi:MAG: glutamyl-tRNA reductase, partial [Candidatus Omnitrophota bacterium]|nr:glutamyl-tRNA reductase [Candidatus Omnitrophota bacterium]
CNRIEMYIGNITTRIAAVDCLSLLTSYHGIKNKQVTSFMYYYKDSEAIGHLFKVASGLDSLVIGETQILGQVKKAYHEALELGSTGKVLNKVFQKALSVGKKARTRTKINEGNVSISSISCQLADEVLHGLKGKKILLIGTGKIGMLTLKTLRQRGIDTILVSSRNYDKAKILSKEFNGTVVRFEELEAFMVDADVVISATSAPHYIVSPTVASRVVKKRNCRPLVFIDVALPRDINPMVAHIDGIHLYNIDSLKDIAAQNMKRREGETLLCQKIVTKEKETFIKKNKGIQGENDKLFKNIMSRDRGTLSPSLYGFIKEGACCGMESDRGL